MTLEEILGKPIEEIEKLTDAELEEHFKQYFPLTRPEQVKRERSTSNGSSTAKPPIVLTPQKQAALQLLRDQGVDLSFLKGRVKK